MTKHYKAILLVLASEDVPIESTFRKANEECKPLYPFMRSIYQSYMFSHPDIKVLFVYGAGTSFNRQEYDLVYDDIPENYYPGMIAKTLAAMEHIDQTYNYDYLIRTNLSTFWDFNKLIDKLNLLPFTNCMAGTQVLMKDEAGNELNYVSGFDMIISRDLIKKIIPFKSEIIADKVWQNLEDLAICNAVNRYSNFSMDTNFVKNNAALMGMCPFDEDHYNIRLRDQQAKNLNHFRVKNRTDRRIDKQILKRLLLYVYDKTL